MREARVRTAGHIFYHEFHVSKALWKVGGGDDGFFAILCNHDARCMRQISQASVLLEFTIRCPEWDPAHGIGNVFVEPWKETESVFPRQEFFRV